MLVGFDFGSKSNRIKLGWNDVRRLSINRIQVAAFELDRWDEIKDSSFNRLWNVVLLDVWEIDALNVIQ